MQQENALRLQKHSPSIISLASSVPLSPSNSMSTSITSKYRPHTKLLTVKDIIRDQKPVALEGWAAVVMCDVSGYSSLASFLALRGPDGAEILGRIMKEYLDKVR
ncbi:hypothetical protein HMI55_004301 [Coelomomyces lativittatus]|nr:hypothetical protein HMI55_004301 [Coelomomyces lativittatus]